MTTRTLATPVTADVVARAFPGAEVSCRGNIVIWHAPLPAPTANEIEAACAAARVSIAAIAEIARLEATITPRRQREAALTTEGLDWLHGVEAAIAVERAKV